MPSSRATSSSAGRDLDRLQEAEHVGEPQADEAHAALLDGAQHVLVLALHAPVYGRSRSLSEAGGRAGNRAFTLGQRPGNCRPEDSPDSTGQAVDEPATRHGRPATGRSERGSTGDRSSGDQGGVHLDRRHRADRASAFEDEDPDGRPTRPADLGLRRFEHEPGAGQELRLRAAARVRRAPTRSAAATTCS